MFGNEIEIKVLYEEYARLVRNVTQNLCVDDEYGDQLNRLYEDQFVSYAECP